jgi:predicted enzyme related to lactoylglutathione lyase
MWAFSGQRSRPSPTGALVKVDNGPAGPGGGVIVYFVWDDCAVEAGSVAENAGKVIKQKFSIGEYGNIALVNDTEGNLIAYAAKGWVA